MKLAAQIQLFSRVSFLDKLLFTKHLAVMIKSGITIAEALGILIDQTKSASFKNILFDVLRNIQNGQTLAKSLSQYPTVFNQFYINLVKVGEESGTLEESLEFLAEQMTKEYSLKRKIKAALLYPGLVFSTTFIMGGFISLFILPKLVDFFEAFEVELPIATQILLFFANLMKNHGIFLFASIILTLLTSYFLLRTYLLKPIWHKILLKFPVIGPLFHYGQLAHFARNLGTLLKSAVPIETSLETTSATLDNVVFKRALIFAKGEVLKGRQLASALKDSPSAPFPLLVVKMIAVGEKTGKLEQTLLYLADFYEEEIDNISKNLTTVLEPILLIIIGLVVGFVALAIISPIYELTGSIRK